jgi:hypothetical protein
MFSGIGGKTSISPATCLANFFLWSSIETSIIHTSLILVNKSPFVAQRSLSAVGGFYRETQGWQKWGMGLVNHQNIF